jgi:hypothetical protein
MLSDGCSARVTQGIDFPFQFGAAAPVLFLPLRFFCCRPDLQFLKATGQFSWFVSSATE